jgi:hypothetical protein
MILTDAIVLLVAMYLCTQSAWSLNNFMRLRKKRKNPNFSSQCNMSPSYVETGYVLAIVSLVGSLIIIGITLTGYIYGVKRSQAPL